MPNKLDDDDDHIYTKLPQDVIFQILTKLPTKSLLKLRSVSKFFKFLISLSYFLKIHISSLPFTPTHHLIYHETTDYTKAYFSFHETLNFSLCKKLLPPFESVHGYLRLVGSSKGVVCLFDTNYFTCIGPVILWNPFIGKFKILPSLREFNFYQYMAVGFGFDQTSHDFKVVSILYDCDRAYKVPPKALIYSAKIGSWRIIPQIVPCYIPRDWSSNLFVNGVVHWLAYAKLEFEDQCDCIMGFDVEDEIFKVIELPRNHLGQNCRELRLSPSADEKSLVLFAKYRENNGVKWGVWFMNDYGKSESWTRNYYVVLEQIFCPLKIVKDGGILAARNDGKLVLIDTEKDEVLDLAVCGLPMSFCTTGYVPSLGLIDIGQQLVE